MIHLIRAEWLKLSRRPMAWVLLIIFLLLVLLRTSALFLLLALTDGIFTGGDVTMELLEPAQIAQFRLQISFPGVFGDALSQINGLGGVFAVILAAGTLGNEYTWGTLRLHLSRHPDRGRYLLAKLIGLLLVLLVGFVITIVVQAVLALLFGSVLGNVGRVGITDLLLLPVGVLRALYVILPYLLFTFVACTLGRSVMAGVAGGVLFVVLDVSAGAFSYLAELGGVMEFVYNLLLQQNINTLVVINSQSYGLDPSVLVETLDRHMLPHPLQATLVIAFYSALFAGYAYALITRRDVVGAS
jgi:ABC-2 type transport system permease protein